MAMGQERAHAEFVGQGHSLTVIVCSRLGYQRITLRSDVAEEPEGPCLMSPFLVLTADLESALGQCERLVHASGQHRGLALPGEGECMEAHASHGGGPLHGLLQQWHSFGDSA